MKYCIKYNLYLCYFCQNKMLGNCIINHWIEKIKNNTIKEVLMSENFINYKDIKAAAQEIDNQEFLKYIEKIELLK